MMAMHIYRTSVQILKLRHPSPCQDQAIEIRQLQQPHLDSSILYLKKKYDKKVFQVETFNKMKKKR